MEFETVFIRQRDPTWNELQQQLEANAKHRASRTAKPRKYTKDEVALVAGLREAGVDYFQHPSDWRAYVPVLWQRQQVDDLSAKGLEFIRENFDVKIRRNGFGKRVLIFQAIPSDGGKLESVLANKTGQTRASVKAILSALISHVKQQLRQKRRVRLPELGTIVVQFRKATPVRRGRNPRTGEEVMLAAQPDRNRVKVKTAKSLREFVSTLPVRKKKLVKKRKPKPDPKKKPTRRKKKRIKLTTKWKRRIR